jgi:membrane protease YdiL (CAAX protease family)
MTKSGVAPRFGNLWARHLRGHFLQFDPEAPPAHTAAAGVRLLALAAGLEALRLAAVNLLYPQPPLWLLTPILLGVALVSVPAIARTPLSRLGLRPWSTWSDTEKSYFVQVVLLATGLLVILLVAAPAGQGDAGMRSFWSVFAPYLFFGFYQELVYRGMVQLEMVRRWGAARGIIGANLLYTAGPLHWGYFASPPSVAGPMFASIFLIGLFFGALYHRSRNLWIVACFHAIGNAVIVWRLGPVA